MLPLLGSHEREDSVSRPRGSLKHPLLGKAAVGGGPVDNASFLPGDIFSSVKLPQARNTVQGLGITGSVIDSTGLWGSSCAQIKTFA